MIDRKQWIQASECLDWPTEGPFAWELWRLCSSMYGLPHDDAAQLYRDCGYIPFCGYPLVRSGKIETMTRGEIAAAFETNPVLLQWGKVAKG